MKAFGLYILSLILKIPFSILGLTHKAIVDRNYKEKFYEMAQSNDRFVNVTCAELFNRVLLTKDSKHKFGDGRETISSVLGRNAKAGTLSKHGIWWDKKLHSLDPGHTIKAIGWRKKL